MSQFPFINFEHLQPGERIVIVRDPFSGRTTIWKEPASGGMDGCLSWLAFLVLLALAFIFL